MNRRPLTHADIDAIVAINNAFEADSPVPIVTTRDDIANTFDEPRRDLAVDSLGIVDGDRLIAYMLTSMRDDPTKEHVVGLDGRVHPEKARQGLGTELVRWGVERATARLATRPNDMRKVMRAYIYEQDTAVVALYESCGFTAERFYIELVRDLTEPIDAREAPADYEIVMWTEDLDERVRIAHNRAFVEHWGSEPLDVESWSRWLSGNDSFLPASSFVALADGAVVGYCMNFAYPDEWEEIGAREAWINGLGTDPDWRGRGIATNLITKSLLAFQEEDYERAALGVDSANASGALGLYRSQGFHPVRREIAFSRQIDHGA